jgi:hypothetical protein
VLEGRAGIGELRDKFFKAATALPQASKDAVFALALAAKADQIAAAGSAGLSSMRLRGVGRRGAKVNVGFDIKGFQDPTAIVQWRGPAQLVNNPTAPHEISPRGRHKALKLPDGFATTVEHPGTHGKKFFEKGVDVTRAQAGQIAKREYHRSLAAHFTGG